MPNSEPRDFAAEYQETLASFLASGEEHELEAAYSLGRAAFSHDASMLDLVDTHRRATEALVDLPTASSQAGQLGASFVFLAEALATYEMAQRGYWEAQERAQRDRSTALMLQHELLPATMPHVDGMDVAVRYLPGEANSHAGGDWYDVFPLDHHRVGLVVGDVTGHGVAAAAAMGQLRIAVLAYALAGYDAAGVVQQVDALLEQLGSNEIATMVYIVASPTDGELVLVNAGHPPPVLIDPAGRSRPARGGHGRLLGMRDGAQARRHELAHLPEGGYLLLYTDGLIEPVERTKENGVARLCEATSGFSGSADTLCDHVLRELAPEGARDDICIVAATLAR
ncbi:MAG: PP2C family protein-serine/threonine phosphatase [Acidimicrobiales bacterium]